MIVHDANGRVSSERAAAAGQSIQYIINHLYSSLLEEGMETVEATLLLQYFHNMVDAAVCLNVMQHQMGKPDKFTAIDEKDNQLCCLDAKCPHIDTCANHRSAGDYRYTDGLSPILERTDIDGIWKCTQTPKASGQGALRADGTYVSEPYYEN